MSLINCNNLTVKIADTQVCDDLTLSINAAENWAILGMNGCGKTTLLHTLAGLLLPQSGDINIGTVNLNTLPRREVA